MTCLPYQPSTEPQPTLKRLTTKPSLSPCQDESKFSLHQNESNVYWTSINLSICHFRNQASSQWGSSRLLIGGLQHHSESNVNWNVASLTMQRLAAQEYSKITWSDLCICYSLTLYTFKAGSKSSSEAFQCKLYSHQSVDERESLLWFTRPTGTSSIRGTDIIDLRDLSLFVGKRPELYR